MIQSVVGAKRAANSSTARLARLDSTKTSRLVSEVPDEQLKKVVEGGMSVRGGVTTIRFTVRSNNRKVQKKVENGK